MAYHIKQTASILKKSVDVYYQGNQRWTTEYDFRKVYETEEESRKDLYIYGGDIIEE